MLLTKGTSRRVIVVDSPDTNLFEQAIFIIRSDVAAPQGVSAQKLVDEACRVARDYSRAHSPYRAWLRPGTPLFRASVCLGGGALALLVGYLL